MHRFFEEQGWDKMQQCAGARKPPLNGPALDGFRALHLYETTHNPDYLKQSVNSLARHEQIKILQSVIYNDKWMRRTLGLNEHGSIPGTMPASVVMGSGCTGNPTIPFAAPGRENLYNVGDRMDWILGPIAQYYFGIMGSEKHTKDLRTIRNQGKAVGVQYPQDQGVSQP
jgi:hypothetical protein